ncbi:MAG: gamma-glutamyltransferase [Fimbriiglobus sp.]|nr:gamma-glutamyltransferase [Fimbriiglobus sp.]
MPRFALVALLVASPLLAASPHDATSSGGMVVSVSPPATDVGVAILKVGGNAVDAAVAVGFTEAVTWPEAGNIGGGGFMLVYPGGKDKPVVIDFRETAPASAKADLFTKGVNYQSITTAGVPGTVRGFELAHKSFGKLKWADVLAPAVKLAEDGFPVTDGLAKRLNMITTDTKTTNAEFLRVFKKEGEWKAGDVLKQPDLAKTLKMIATKGADGFYTGPVAELIAAEMKASGGLISLDDLKAYKAVQREPIVGTYRGFDVIAAPPPSSGGITLLLALKMLETQDVKKNPWGAADTMHLVAEAMRRGFAERAKYLGDPDFVKIPPHLTTKDHAKKLFADFDPNKATKSETLAGDIKISDGGPDTTHYSVVDSAGMAVSTTYTLENAFGCRVVVKGAGFILNNEMTDFNHKPGVTTRTGLIGTDANVIAPGKRMLSSMCPTILTKDGKAVLVTGSPGGRTIINTVLGIVVNVADYGADVRTAVDAPRLHHQWFPDRITLEDRPGFAELEQALKAKGHALAKVKIQGDGHSIWIDPKTGLRTGAADKRLDGSAKGE